MAKKQVILMLMFASAVALTAWTTGFSQSSTKTEAQKDSSSRFQISAWAVASDRGQSHGAYVIETQTGKIWEINPGTAPIEIGVLK